MKKKWLITGLCIAGLTASLGAVAWANQTLRHELQETRRELEALTQELEAALEENGSLKAQAAGLEERADTLAQSSDVFNQIEEGFAQRIRNIYSSSDMEVLAVYPIGEDTTESIRRFFLCNGRYRTEYYLVDYVMGEICVLSSKGPGVKLASLSRDLNGVWPNGDVEWEFRCEDYDGDGEEDILLVTPLYRGGMFLWLQRQGSFLPVNKYYCGEYGGWPENEFCVEIYQLEQMFEEEQNQGTWNADRVENWLREEFFAGRREELEAVLKAPKEKLPYTERREPLGFHVTLSRNAKEQYKVSIPENTYGAEQINRRLQEFYEEIEEWQQELLGIGIEENDVYLSEQERREMGFSFNLYVWPERVDDAVVCLMEEVYTYEGGAHGHAYSGALVFDTRSGKLLQLEDVVWNSEKYIQFAMEYFEENYEHYGWGQEYVRDALLNGGWCFTDYGFRVFLNGGNGLGLYEYEIPYELLLDHLKEDYLPIAWAAEFDMYMEGTARMDVNGDGLLEMVTCPALVDVVTASGQTEKRILFSVNETVTELDPKWQGEALSEQNISANSALLQRQEDGVTRLFWKVDIIAPDGSSQDKHVFVWRIEGESAVFEEDYEAVFD